MHKIIIVILAIIILSFALYFARSEKVVTVYEKEVVIKNNFYTGTGINDRIHELIYKEHRLEEVINFYFDYFYELGYFVDRDCLIAEINESRASYTPLHEGLKLTYYESGFNKHAVCENSNSKDIGLKQLNTLSFDKFTEEELFKPELNIYLSYALLLNLRLDNPEFTTVEIYNAYHRGQAADRKGLHYAGLILDGAKELDILFNKEF